MAIKRVHYLPEPERLIEEKQDCIWIWLADRKEPEPLKSQALQWVDWKLGGYLSRFLAEEGYKGARETTFVPTMGKITAPYLAIEPMRNTDWDQFASNCDGLKIRRVLCFCEEDSQVPSLEDQINRNKAKLPDNVFLGSDRPPAD